MFVKRGESVTTTKIQPSDIPVTEQLEGKVKFYSSIKRTWNA
ncbi:hypothetical protein [Brevibacillus reuszeri]|nr:hypothetical protein [Brevibacillus reuszeri]